MPCSITINGLLIESAEPFRIIVIEGGYEVLPLHDRVTERAMPSRAAQFDSFMAGVHARMRDAAQQGRAAEQLIAEIKNASRYLKLIPRQDLSEFEFLGHAYNVPVHRYKKAVEDLQRMYDQCAAPDQWLTTPPIPRD